MIYVTNAFSLNMLGQLAEGTSVGIAPITAAAVKSALRVVKYRSIVGHADAAALLSGCVKHPIAFNRESVTLSPGDVVIVGQYSGPRLPEGATTLPEGATITWLKVTVGLPARGGESTLTPLRDIGVDQRSIKALALIGVHMVGELRQTSIVDILRIPGMGKRMVQRMEDRLEFVGIPSPWR